MGRVVPVVLAVTTAVVIISTAVFAEVIYLNNGDVLHGTVVGATERAITLSTPYGKLVIPKSDIQRIDYQGAAPEPRQAPKKAKPSSEKPRETKKIARRPSSSKGPVISLDIGGGSFWYAFQGSPDEPADARIRLRFYIGDVEAAVLLDAKHDTVDKNTLYNSFTFSTTDSQVVSTAEGYNCRIVETGSPGSKGVLVLFELPEDTPEQQMLVRMLYQVNQGTREFPGWVKAVSRSFPVPVKPGMETHVVLEQNASGFDYSGFFRKTMKNLESFELRILSSEVR